MVSINLNYDDSNGKVFKNQPTLKGDNKFNVTMIEIWSKNLLDTNGNTKRAIKLSSGNSVFFMTPRTLNNDFNEWTPVCDLLDIDANTELEGHGGIIDRTTNFESLIMDRAAFIKYNNSPKSIYINPQNLSEDDFFRDNNGIVDRVNSLGAQTGITAYTPQQEIGAHDYTADDKYLLILPIKENDVSLFGPCIPNENSNIDLKNPFDVEVVEIEPTDTQNNIPGYLFVDGPISNDTLVDEGLKYREVEGPMVVTGFSTTSIIKVCNNWDGTISSETTEIQRSPIYGGSQCPKPAPPSNCKNCTLVGWRRKTIPKIGGGGFETVPVPIWRDYGDNVN